MLMLTLANSFSVPGFVRGKGDCTSNTTAAVYGSLNDCANMCLQNLTCTTFGYDPINENCRFSGLICRGMSKTQERYSYLKG